MTGVFDDRESFTVVSRNANSSGFDLAVDSVGDVALGHEDGFGWVGPTAFAEVVNAANHTWTDVFLDALDTEDGKSDDTDDTDDEPGQWDATDDILLQNSSNTVGLAETQDALKPLSTDAQSVMVTPSLLREALDVADGIGENNAVWLTVENERPVVMTPKGDLDRLSAVLTPRITMGDTTPPTEDL